jgi:aldose sugar dehydrogenase
MIPKAVAAALALVVVIVIVRHVMTPPYPGVDPRAPNAPGQTPAFPGQTRAPERKANVAFDVVTVADGLENPWGLAFLPDPPSPSASAGLDEAAARSSRHDVGMIVTERPGRMRGVGPDGKLTPPVAGVPPVHARGQGGLLDVTIDPAFASNHFIYWSYAEPRDGDVNNTAVARGHLAPDVRQPRLYNVEVIFRQQPSLQSNAHFGGRLVWGRDGTLFVTLGERFIVAGRRQAQRLDGLLGKIVRINADGSIPDDNPFVGRQGARPEIWSYGHRNVEAATLHPETGELWEVEHGARGGDELNVARKGKDYGWPTITYGIDYDGRPITGGITQKAGMEQPVYYWDPVIAPSGMTFYTGDLFPAWKGSLFIGGLGSTCLVRLTVDGEKIVGEERLLMDLDERIRDVRQGPDGALYLLTDNAKGRILKLVPKK